MSRTSRYSPPSSIFLLCVLLLVLAQPVCSQSLLGLQEKPRVILQGNTHPMARPEFDRGEAPADLPMERMLLLLKHSPARQATLDAFVAQQLDPKSENFHNWLTPQQFGERFGPSDQELQLVTSWLGEQGFHAIHVSNGRALIEFSGTAGQVNGAFHAPIHQYADRGELRVANSIDPSIPSALAPVVAGVVSLNNFPSYHPLHVFQKPTTSLAPSGIPLANPAFTFNSDVCKFQANICHVLGPADLAAIYNISPLWNSGLDGTGQVIAILAGSNIHVQDVRDFRAIFGLPAKDPVIVLNGPDPGIVRSEQNPVESEADADLQWTAAVAPNVTQYLVVSKSTNSTFGMDLSAEYVVDHNLAPIVAASYAYCEKDLGKTNNQFYNQLWQQAAAQGITVLVATGDNGSAGCENFRTTPPAPATSGLQVNGRGSTPYNTAVGGSGFNDASNASAYWNSTNDPVTQASAKGYILEIVWNDSCTNTIVGISTDPETNCNDPSLSNRVLVGGASGGKSTIYPKPAWQVAPGVPNDGMRDIPDVSLFAATVLTSGSAYVLCQTDFGQQKGSHCDLDPPYQHFLLAGGTSISVQVFGGIVALLNQKTNSRQGNINPILYSLASQQTPGNCDSSNPGSSCVFYDISAGTNAMPCLPGTRDCDMADSSHDYGVLTGYNATPGFDLATGLGSINAFNFVNANAWASNTAPDFTLSSPNAVVTVSSGSSAMLTLSIASVNGFTGTFDLGAAPCANLPAAASCSFSPSSVTLDQASPSATVTVTIVTTARSTSASPTRFFSPRQFRDYGLLVGTTLVCIVTILLRGYRTRARLVLITLLVLCASFGVTAGCGGGGASNTVSGTPLGTTNPTITVTNAGISHSLVFTLTVN